MFDADKEKPAPMNGTPLLRWHERQNWGSNDFIPFPLFVCSSSYRILLVIQATSA